MWHCRLLSQKNHVLQSMSSEFEKWLGSGSWVRSQQLPIIRADVSLPPIIFSFLSLCLSISCLRTPWPISYYHKYLKVKATWWKAGNYIYLTSNDYVLCPSLIHINIKEPSLIATIDTINHSLWSAATTSQASERCWRPLSRAFLIECLLGPHRDLNLCTKGIDTLNRK